MEALVEAGIRDRLKVILGGACINSAYATEIGPDAAANDAIDGVAICRKWAGVS
jgi:5-methyltetrahydrofolate--homocysteine methyltransferase